MSVSLEDTRPWTEFPAAVTAGGVALRWLLSEGVPDAAVESVARPSSWTAEVYYRRPQSFWVLACMRRERIVRVVETPFVIYGLVTLSCMSTGWTVTGTQSVLPPELICGDADLYLPGGGRKYDRILLSCHPERYGLHPPRVPAW